MTTEVFSPEVWAGLAEEAHLLCFHEKRDPSMNRIDFALAAVEDGKICTYTTVRELDGESIYLQYGGAMPEAKGTPKSFNGWMAMLVRLKEAGYKRAAMYVENTNKPMLRFAVKAGFLITGIRTFEGAVLVEHQLNFEDMEV